MQWAAADAVVRKALFVQAIIMPDIATIKDDWCRESVFHHAEIWCTEFIPLGAHDQPIAVRQAFIHVIDIVNIKAIFGEGVAVDGVKGTDVCAALE